jgi:D-alanyl-D-alanine carboxypeptidase (penicillin-binding protein 5/6)
MVGSLLSVLLMGMFPVWGPSQTALPVASLLDVMPPTPIAGDAAHVGQELEKLRLSASGVVVVDLASAQTLFARGADDALPMASLTKLMTGLLTVENADLDAWVKIPVQAGEVAGNKAGLPAGEHFRIGDLLSALLIASANDAAVALAMEGAGSTEAFVSAMNDRATSLGLQNTTFANVAGLDADGQSMSPRDVAWLGMYVLRFPEIRARMSRRGTTIQSREGTQIPLTHTHALLHAATSGVIAGKTGTTEDAGQCLFSVVEAETRQFLVVLLHSGARYMDMRRILDVLEG